MQTKWLQKWIFVPYVFRRYQSGDVTKNHSNDDAMMLSGLGQFRSSSASTFSAALLQLVLQANTEPFRNGLTGMRSRLGTIRVPAKFSIQMKHSKQTCIFCTLKHEILSFYYNNLFYLMNFLKIFRLWKYLWSVVNTNIFCVGARVSTLMSSSDWLRPYIFRRKMEKTRPMREEMDGKVFISRQSWHFLFIVKIIKALFPICTLIWRVDNYVSRQGRALNRRNESTNI